MRISKNFVILFLVSFLVVILGNVVALGLNFYKSWMGYTLIGFLFVFCILFFRKKLKSKDEKKQKKYLTLIKLFFTIIPLLIVGYIFYANFVASHEFISVYDIGSEQDSSKPYLSPLNRISEADLNESYRNLTSQLVYFNVPVPRGSDRVIIQTKLKNPSLNSSISLGAKNKPEWSYLSNQIYNPILENLKLTGEITRLNKEMPLINSTEDIPDGAIVATDLNLQRVENGQDYTIKNSTFEYYLRDSHTFYVYLDGSLDLYVEKRDINWYEGEDNLTVLLSNLEGDILGNVTILDDGSVNKSKINNITTNGSLKIENLENGVYILDFKGNADTIITKIKINTDKIVTNKIFSADSSNYASSEDKSVSFYTEANKNSTISFQTYHQPYVQNISINDNKFSMINTSQILKVNLTKGDYKIVSQKSNLIISSSNYLAFSKENYFEPFTYSIVSIPASQEDLRNVDYLITKYNSVKKEGDWIVTQASFDVKDLYIKDGKLSLMFNVPHLADGKNETNTQYVSVDSINITIQKNGWKI